VIVVGPRYVAGHYEWRLQKVLVEPEHYEQRWVPPVTEMRTDEKGNSYTVEVRAGYYERVLVPARYEDRWVQVWIPGHHRSAPGFHFRFNW
jgi:hypothetical protein